MIMGIAPFLCAHSEIIHSLVQVIGQTGVVNYIYDDGDVEVRFTSNLCKKFNVEALSRVRKVVCVCVCVCACTITMTLFMKAIHPLL